MAAKLSGGGGGRFSVDQNAEINVTPFVDVMLVLLIIFMVAAPLAIPAVKLALPPAVALPTPNPPRPVYISIQKNGKIYIGDRPSDLDTLSNDLRTTLSGRRDPTKERIFIRCDKNTMYGDFMGVMNALQDAGYYSVALQGADQRGGAGGASEDDN